MPELPQKKVGIVACSGEELPEGTVTRLAALRVLERLRPADTVTICLPLFLAGGEGDRAFARFYPTIAVDGCELRCAARATEMYSAKPAASLVVNELLDERGMARPQGRRRLDEAGRAAVDAAAERIAVLVDELLGKPWNRREGAFAETAVGAGPADQVQATCSCGSGIPVQQVSIEGQAVTLVALPLIFEELRGSGKKPEDLTGRGLLGTVAIYNPIPSGSEEAYAAALLREYAAYCGSKEPAQ
jgi:uncharacterized metal-binding protein